MASIEERAGNYRVRWRRGGRSGTPESCTFESFAFAERAKKLAEAHRHDITGDDVEAIVLGVEPVAAASTVMTVAEFAPQWLASRTRMGPDQKRRVRSQLDRVILPAIGDNPLDHVTGRSITSVLEGLRENELQASTRTRYFATLNSLFRFAEKEGLIPDNPCGRTDFVRDLIDHDDSDLDEEHVYLTRDEYWLIRRNMAPAGQPVIDFLIETGCRWSEATAVAASAVQLQPRRGVAPFVPIVRAWKRDEKGGWYLGSPKGRSKRNVDLSDWGVVLTGQLMAFASYLGAEDPFLLSAPRGGRVLHPNFRQRYWEPAVAAAMRCPKHMPPTPEKGPVGPARAYRPWEVSTCDCSGRLQQRPTLHDLRHTHVAWLIEAGHPMKAISRRIGHRTTEVTETIYAGILPVVNSSMAATLNVMLSGDPAAAAMGAGEARRS